MKHLFFLLGFFTVTAQADYAWIPEAQNLHLRGGFDYFLSGNNYSTDGYSDPTQFGGQTIQFRDSIFWLAPEFGVAEDWSAGLHLQFSTSTATSDATSAVVASGAGFGDVRGNIKWRVSQAPLWTIETYFKMPTGTATPLAADEIVMGDGNLDVGLRAHYGMRTGAFFLSASPGVLGRFGGYSPALTLELAAQMFIYRAYAKLYAHSLFSLSAQALTPATVTAQTLAGTAGSYARLAASPTYLVGGGSLGILINKQIRAEAGVSKVIWGQRTHDALVMTLNVLAMFDFSKPDMRTRVREVPFENAPEEY